MLVLEPGNLEKLKNGEPIHKFLNEFIPELREKIELIFSYSPDLNWVAEQMKKQPMDGIALAKVIAESLTRGRPVIVSGDAAERMKKQH